MKYSILIPAYKETFLKECIDSILNQTYSDFEIIIVNDNSPYKLDDIIHTYNDSRIRYYKNDKGFGAINLAGNYNKCLEYAKGDYTIILGDDDKLISDCLENYNKLMIKYPDLDLYHTRLQFIDEKSEVFDVQEPRPEYESVYSMILFFWRHRRQRFGDWLFKTSTLRDNGGFFFLKLGWGTDDLSAFIAAREKGVANTSTFGFQYRENQQTITSNSNYAFIKAETVLELRKWYNSFLECVPNDPTDKLYRNILKRGLNQQLNKYIIANIETSLNEHPNTLFRWLKECKQYKVSKLKVLSIFTHIMIYKAKTSLKRLTE